MAIIGIDLGTTNSLACVYRDGRAELIPNELGEYKTSSTVSVLENGTILVGAAAKDKGQVLFDRQLFGYISLIEVYPSKMQLYIKRRIILFYDMDF